jgi:hypothetical protein
MDRIQGREIHIWGMVHSKPFCVSLSLVFCPCDVDRNEFIRVGPILTFTYSDTESFDHVSLPALLCFMNLTKCEVYCLIRICSSTTRLYWYAFDLDRLLHFPSYFCSIFSVLFAPAGDFFSFFSLYYNAVLHLFYDSSVSTCHFSVTCILLFNSYLGFYWLLVPCYFM